jgi:hypothetical protein
MNEAVPTCPGPAHITVCQHVLKEASIETMKSPETIALGIKGALIGRVPARASAAYDEYRSIHDPTT